MPTLHWIGKDKVINHHLDVPFKVLEHSYGFDTPPTIKLTIIQTVFILKNEIDKIINLS